MTILSMELKLNARCFNTRDNGPHAHFIYRCVMEPCVAAGVVALDALLFGIHYMYIHVVV